MSTRFLTIGLSSILLLVIIELIRRERLTFKYAMGWLSVSFLAIIFAIFNDVIFKIAYFFGFEIPSNFIFFICLFCLIFLSLLLTIFLCQQNERNDKIVQKIAILEHRISEVEQNK